MKRPTAAAAAFAAIAALACGAAPAQTILYTFTGLPGGAADSCKWFDDELNNDRSVGALTRQTNLLYNRVALPVDTNVAISGTATTEQGEALVDFKLGPRLICTAAEAIYGPTPEPSMSP
ncbi:MAG: hypothetical protein JO190_11200 [Candidatus Eremiobacteraeota bacterium]|nr:hypothetical protein [Candidatus Eremiobacteraeota bacterium]